MEDHWDIKRLLDWATEYFKGKGIESARLDAELLLAYALRIQRLELYLQFERPLNAAELASFKALIKRRVEQEPIAYITHKKEFWSRDFLVEPGVLVPRPDTEILIEVVLDRLKNVVRRSSFVVRGFEFGVGSGNIAVTLLAEVPELNMTAVEISEKATEIAETNAKIHGVLDRLQLIQDKLFGSNDERQTTKYDFVISNPPYIKSSEIAELAKTVKDYEPRQALDGGEDGLKYYRLLTNWAKEHLKEEGFLVVEIGEDQGDEVSGLFCEAGFKQVEVKKDYAGLDRVVIGGK